MRARRHRWWAWRGSATNAAGLSKRVRGVGLLTPAWHERWPRSGAYALAAKREGSARPRARVLTDRQVTAPPPRSRCQSGRDLYRWRMKGNPGRGAGACSPSIRKGAQLFGGEASTTNTGMELTAGIGRSRAQADESRWSCTPYSQVTCRRDHGVDRGWKGERVEDRLVAAPVKNVDLWKKLDELRPSTNADWRWVKGHRGPHGNERADALANMRVGLGRQRVMK